MIIALPAETLPEQKSAHARVLSRDRRRPQPPGGTKLGVKRGPSGQLEPW